MPYKMEKNQWALNSIQRTVDNWKKLGKEEVLFPRKENTNFLSSAKQSALKIYIQIQHTNSAGYIRNVHIHIHSLCNSKDNRGHEDEREQGVGDREGKWWRGIRKDVKILIFSIEMQLYWLLGILFIRKYKIIPINALIIYL